jgi:hypothetical protein
MLYDPRWHAFLYDKGYGCRRGHDVWSWVAASPWWQPSFIYRSIPEQVRLCRGECRLLQPWQTGPPGSRRW